MAQPPEAPTASHLTLRAKLVDQWLVFACPGCDQAVKIPANDIVHLVECPSCHQQVESLLDTPPVLSPDDASAIVFIPARRRRASTLPGRRPSTPGKKFVQDLAKPRDHQEFIASHRTEEHATLPVRSPEELEARQVQASRKHRLHEDDPLARFELVDDRQHQKKYKRVKTRTRRKRITEKKRAQRFYTAILASALLATFLIFHTVRFLQARDFEGLQTGGPSFDPNAEFIDDPKRAVARFLQSDSPEQMTRYVRKPGVLIDLMRAYYEEEGIPSPIIRDVIMHRQETGLPRGFETGRVVYSDRPAAVFFVEKTDIGGYRLDWPSFVGHGTISWKMLRQTMPRNPHRLRVYASPADYYAGPFADAGRYFCLRLEDIDRTHSIYGYARADRTDNQPLRNLLLQTSEEENQDVSLPLTLEVQYPPGDCPDNQIEVLRLVRDSWLIP
ncbi:MAG TPA: hypothetical protein VMN36_16715 [Verrucomicrobiales bacterium]|nr:hypothetical protein [Verrucomicrobiales bacterium]